MIQNKEFGSSTSGYFAKKIPLWLLASIIYGMSWSMLIDFNLSFLAWFAFIPLFVDLEKKETFQSFYRHSLYFSATAYFIICHGFLFTPRNQLLVAAGAVSELLMSSVSFAFLYPIKKRYSFRNALILFPFIISLWEWIYSKLEHTLGYLMLSHSQSENIWLIQYIDIFGEWSIAFWVMLFNVLLYFEYKKKKRNLKLFLLSPGVAKIFVIMLLPPLGYYAYRSSEIKEETGKKINVTLINTHFEVSEITSESSAKKVERLTFITDSIDYVFKQEGRKTDLYVWHEGAIEYGDDTTFSNFIQGAVTDWQTPLLTGMLVQPESITINDKRKVNRVKRIRIVLQ